LNNLSFEGKRKEEQCPVCFGELEIRECAPCDDCGWNVATEIEDFKQKIHTYTTYDIYQGLRLTLCDFCAVDFGSYKSEYFGFKNEKRIGLGDFNLIRQVEHPEVVKDKFCPECSARLKFLKFVAEIRSINEKQPEEPK
jgi:hypothetical protein